MTERVRLTTQVLLAPWRLNAKQAATVHHLSGGRMVLGGSATAGRQVARRPSSSRGRPRPCGPRGGRRGREGEPRLTALAYFGLGPTAVQDAEPDLRHYYAWLGDEVASKIAASAGTDEGAVQAYAKAFEDAGCDELTLSPTSTDPRQVDVLADAVGLEDRPATSSRG